MNHKLLTKFVFSGMQKNKKTLIPYLLAGTMTVMIYYILQSLAHCPYIYKDGVEAFYGAQIISILLEISGQIVAVFAAVFLFYTNQFMIRARKKEMGLYGVLGMSKKNITYILAAESLIHALTSIITGIMMGTFLNKLMLLILYKIINQPPVNGLFFSVEALKSTLVLFVILFAVSLIYNVASIRVGCSCAKFLTQILIFFDTNFSAFSGSILRKLICIFCVKINKNLYIKQHIFYNYFR